MNKVYRWRKYCAWLLLAFPFCVLLWRAYDLQILRREFLTLQRDARQQRIVKISAHRGMIVDRHGEALAISTPVDSIWLHPGEFLQPPGQIKKLATALQLSVTDLRAKIEQNRAREFVYIKRHLAPYEAEAVLALDLQGVYAQREYRRYYPAGEIAGHLLGFTDIDDNGQEGIELAFNDWLSGQAGSKRVIKDRLGHVIETVESLRAARDGQDLRLSIDKRLQYLSYRALKAAVYKQQAQSGSLVMLDVRSNEVLALVNQPAFNPNNRKDFKGYYYRNRAITDVFEPGSTMKPFTIAAALQSGRYDMRSQIDTRPGFIKVGGYKISDLKNNGVLDLAGILRYSSNVGASRIALSLPAQELWNIYDRLGFGATTASGFPGEAAGHLRHYSEWRDAEQASLSYGYGIAITALQLAQAYSVLANDGDYRPISLIYKDKPAAAHQLVAPEIAQQVRKMLQAVVSEAGSGRLAKISGYTIAGKTGTSHKAKAGSYAENEYFSLFAGIAPAQQPRLVAVVVINEPKAGDHFGGDVAAPVFAQVVGDALRVLNVRPDDLPRYAALP